MDKFVVMPNHIHGIMVIDMVVIVGRMANGVVETQIFA